MSVTSLNKEVDEFNKNISLLKKYQCFPVLMVALESCIKLNANIEIISDILKDIFACDEDQFWCLRQSNYYKKNKHEFSNEKYSNFLDSNDDFINIINSFSLLLNKMSLNFVNYEWGFLSESDYNFLKNATLKKEEKKEIISETSIFSDEISEAFTNTIKETVEYEKERVRFLKKELDENLKFLPFAYFLKETPFFKKHHDSISSLSNYFEEYFCSNDDGLSEAFLDETIDENFENDEISDNELSENNDVAFIKIFASILFSRFMKINHIEFNSNSVENVLKERHSNHLFESTIKENKNFPYYISIISNIKVFSSLLEVGAVANNIINKDEVFGKFLLKYTDKKAILDIHNRDIILQYMFLFIPNNLMHILLKKLTGEHCSCLDRELIPLISKGFIFDGDYEEIHEKLDIHLSNYFKIQGDEKKFDYSTKEFVLNNLSSWLIPLNLINEIEYHTEFTFFEYPLNETMISNALTISDEKNYKSNCLLPYQLITDFRSRFEHGYFDEEIHPALHSVYFAASIIPKDIKKWTDVSFSFLHHKQTYFACLIIGLLFEIETLNESILEKYNENINQNTLYDILENLSKLRPFPLIEESIRNYLKNTQNRKIIGFLGGYINLKNEQLVTNLEEKKLPTIINFPSKVSNLDLPNICILSKFHFEKGLNIINSNFHLDISIGLSAITYICLGLESELKSRTEKLNYEALNDLKKNHIKIPLTLGSFIFILKKFNYLNHKTKIQMPEMNKIYCHPNYKKFLSSCFDILKIRNGYSLSHPQNTDELPDKDKIIENCIFLKTELLDNNFLDVLCSSN